MGRTTSAGLAICAAAGLLIAGCSSTVQGEAQAGSPLSTSPAATSSTATSATRSSARTTTSASESTSESTTETSESTDTSSSDTRTTESGPAAGLDPATQSWFSTFCTRAADVSQYVSPDTSGQSLTEAQQTIVSAYSNISISASTSVGLLQATPAPTVAGGADLQTTAIESFTAVSDVYGRGALTVLALTPTSVSDLKTAIDAIEAEATASIPNSTANVDPSVLAAAKQLPECQDVLG